MRGACRGAAGRLDGRTTARVGSALDATEFRKTGEEKVGSTPTTHYRGRPPFSALTLEMSEDALRTAGTLRSMVGGEIPVPIDVWVDEQARAARVRMSLDLEGAASSVSTLALTGLGRPIEVTVPHGAVRSTPTRWGFTADGRGGCPAGPRGRVAGRPRGRGARCRTPPSGRPRPEASTHRSSLPRND